MKMVADTHIHMYPCYDAGRALRNLVANLAGLCPGAARVAFLAERADCNWFEAVRNGDTTRAPGFEVRSCVDPDCVTIRGADGEEVHIFAGRQIAAAERVELLSLTSDMRIPDGLPAREVVAGILDSGAVPVLGWAPGKWMFSRRPVVEGLIREFGARLLIGDTTLRPPGWSEPELMRRAERGGSGIVAGSDPLPFPGEERRLGTYAVRFEGGLDTGSPVSSARALLTAAGPGAVRCGRRCGPVTVALRLLRNARVR